MRWWPRASSCILHMYTVRGLYFPHWMSRWEKNKHATCTIFSAFCTKPNDPMCYKRPRQSLYINLFHSLSPKWSSHFPQLSIRGWYFRKKYEYVSQHTMRVSTCIIHVQLAESRTLVSNNIYSTGLVKAVGTGQCINFVNAGDLE